MLVFAHRDRLGANTEAFGASRYRQHVLCNDAAILGVKNEF